MGIKVQRTRCFLDIGISNVLGKEVTLLTAYLLMCLNKLTTCRSKANCEIIMQLKCLFSRIVQSSK